MSLRKLASETAVYGLSSILGRGLYFLLTPLYTGLFSERESGVMTSLFALISLVLVVAGLRLDIAYFRFSGKADEGRLLGTAATVTALVSLALAAVLALLRVPLADAMGFPEYAHLFLLAGGILFFDALTELPLARLRLQGRAWRFALVRLGGIVVNLGLNVAWLYVLPRWSAAPAWLMPATGQVTYVFLANLLASALVLALLWPELQGRRRADGALDAGEGELRHAGVRWGIDRAVLKDLWRFSGPLVIVGLSFIVNEMLDRQILPLVWPGGKAEGLQLLGVYGQNYKLAMLLALFTQAFRYGVEPFVFRESGSEDARDKYARLAHYYLIAALVGVLTVTLFLPMFSQLFLRQPGYRTGSDVVPILLWANLLLGLYYNFSVWYKVTDATRWGAYIGVGGALVTVVLNLLLIPRYGFYGCAWATLICYGSMAAAALTFGQRRYRIPYPAGRMLGYVGLALALAGLSGWLSPKLARPVMHLAIGGGTPAEWLRFGGLGAGLLVVFLLVVSVVEGRSRRRALVGES